ERKKKAEAERKRKAEAEKKKQEEARRKAEEERKRKEEERKKAEAEKKRQEELARKKAAEEAKREAERKRQAEEAARRKAMEDALAAEMAAEESAREQREIANAQSRYAKLLSAHIKRYWTRPPAGPDDFQCEVAVSQMASGEVIDVQISKSCGSVALDESVRKAVLRSSPLPKPDDPRAFAKNLNLIFKPR
ncbi:MAG: cell envelope integrity protein TolA, partial [Salinisphaeraceae bacterium]|nr:cell envelope integrity protein TolA [Salinisphaeraceae bacterium]